MVDQILCKEKVKEISLFLSQVMFAIMLLPSKLFEAKIREFSRTNQHRLLQEYVKNKTLLIATVQLICQKGLLGRF